MYRKFEDIVRDFLHKNPNDLNQYLINEFRNSKSETYYGFFDSFLFSYGIPSINFCPTFRITGEYTGYITFQENNVFNSPSETFRHIGNEYRCQIAVANKLIDLVNSVTLDDFKNYKSNSTF